MFNMVVDTIVQYWIAQVLEDKDAAINGDPGGTKIASLFYADNGVLTFANLTPRSLNLLVDFFHMMNLEANTIKTKSMVCLPTSVQTTSPDQPMTGECLVKAKHTMDRNAGKSNAQSVIRHWHTHP
jgi:hypothetical protein